MESSSITKCIVKNTHSKFNEAFILWEQAYENYFKPDRFIANINALIQALRNITFSLQAEKGSIPNFASWYEKWQNQFKEDEIMQWICNARTQIVHKKDFEVNSHANIRIYDYSTIYCAGYRVPIDMPNDAIVGMLAAQGIVNSAMIRSEVIFEITRYWAVDRFREYNILYILLCFFPVFSNMIVDAHKQAELNINECEFIRRENAEHFPEKLIRLISDTSKPIVRKYSLKDLEPKDIKATVIKGEKEDFELAKKHYGTDLDFSKKAFIDNCIDTAKIILKKDGFHLPMSFIIYNDNRCQQIYLELKTRSDKYIAMEKLAEMIRDKDVKEVIVISEAFSIPNKYKDLFLQTMDINSVPEKDDVLHICHIQKGGREDIYEIPFKKDDKGVVTIGEHNKVNVLEDNIMLPIIEVMK